MSPARPSTRWRRCSPNEPGARGVIPSRAFPGLENTVRWLAASLLLLLAATSMAADVDAPHPHQGLVEPYPSTPPPIALDAGQLATLARGESVLTQIEIGSGGRAAAIQDIQAPTDSVIGRILDYRAYPRMVKHVALCEPYYEAQDEIRVRFILKVVGIGYEYFIKHTLHPAPPGADAGQPRPHYVTWTLDYSRESDLDESVGYWYVEPHPEKEGWSRLYYSIDMRTRGWMPGFIRNMVAARGLRDATSWVKRESEGARAISAAP